MGDLMFNPFEPVALDRIDVDVRVEYRRDVAEIVGVSLPGEDVHAGDTVPLRVTLRPYAGDEYVETIPVDHPAHPRRRADQDRGRDRLAGAARHAAGRIAARLHRQPAQVLHGRPPSWSRCRRPTTGASLRGRLLRGLPASAMDTLRPANQTRRADAYRIADRTVFPMKRLVSGKQELQILVKTTSSGTSDLAAKSPHRPVPRSCCSESIEDRSPRQAGSA